MKKQLLLLVITLLPMVAMADDSGSCGENVTWTYEEDTKTVTISGTGNMYNYDGELKQPWRGLNIENIVIEEGVTSIGDFAFFNYGKNCVIPNTVCSIGVNAFRFSGITSLEIPHGVNSIGNYAFSECYYLEKVTISGNDCIIGTDAFSLDHNLKELDLQEGLKVIGDRAFRGCQYLSTINIPNSVTSIGDNAFQDCNGLTSVNIDNLESWCNIDFGDYGNPLLYANHLFLNGAEIRELNIPESIASIGRWAFAGCSSLISVNIPPTVTSILDGAFSNCENIARVSIPDGVKTIGSYAFYWCNSINSITIPNSTTYIGHGAFEYCKNLTNVILGCGVNIIRSMAFASCINLKDVYCYALTVPNTESDVFQDSFIETASLHVTVATYHLFFQTEPWKNFKEILTIDGDIPEIPKCSKPTINYQNGILTFLSETDGVDFISEITDIDIKKNYTNEVHLTASYNITVFATKPGYDDSNVAYATLCWIDKEPTIATDVMQVHANAVLIQNDGGIFTVHGIDDGTQVSVYDVDGTEAGRTVSRNGGALISTNLRPGSIAIVKISEKSVKVIVK